MLTKNFSFSIKFKYQDESINPSNYRHLSSFGLKDSKKVQENSTSVLKSTLQAASLRVGHSLPPLCLWIFWKWEKVKNLNGVTSLQCVYTQSTVKKLKARYIHILLLKPRYLNLQGMVVTRMRKSVFEEEIAKKLQRKPSELKSSLSHFRPSSQLEVARSQPKIVLWFILRLFSFFEAIEKLIRT